MLSFRLAWGIWIASSLVDSLVYQQILSRSGMHPRALLLAVLFLLQAICIPIYASRTVFAGPLEAAIRCAAIASIFAALASTFSGSTEQFLSIPISSEDLSSVQLGYVVSILLLNGITGGIVIGLLRWRIISAPGSSIAPPPANSGWRKDLRSYVIWIACVTFTRWLFNAFSWIIGLSSDKGILAAAREFYPFRGSFLAYVGIVLIAPLPFIFSPSEEQSRSTRIVKYASFAFAIGALVDAACSATNLSWPPVLFLYLFIVICTPCLLWAVLYATSLQSFPVRSPFSGSPPSGDSTPPGSLISRAVWLSLLGYACALLVGWLATTRTSSVAPRTSNQPAAMFPLTATAILLGTACLPQASFRRAARLSSRRRGFSPRPASLR